jgi:hypothetical protein
MGKVVMSDLALIRPESPTAEEELTALVLNGVTSPHSRRAYSTGLAQFFAWVKASRPQPFSKALVQEYRVWLLEQKALVCDD